MNMHLETRSRHRPTGAIWNHLGERTARMHFGPSFSSPASARHFVDRTARGWGYGDVSDVAELLVSEVVTNAIEHGHSGGIVQVIALPAGLRVEVSDRSTETPAPRTPTLDEPTGRGLAIVSKLARHWGVDLRRNGKTVWFELDDVGTA